MPTPWITTFTGRHVNPLDLRPEDIDIRDIAHHLALINRFVGATREPISVAQHSVYVMRLVPQFPRKALLHDASEAYLGDVSKWLKHSGEFDSYLKFEAKAQEIIEGVFKCEQGEAAEEALEYADRLMVRFEAMKGLKDKGSKLMDGHNPRYPPVNLVEINKVGRWAPWSWRDSEESFLTAWRCIESGIFRDALPRLIDFPINY